MNSIHLQALAFALVFCSVFMRGIQHKNVIHNRILGATVMSGLIYAFDGSIVLIIATSQSFAIIASNAIGAALGMMSAILVYNFYSRGKS